jgi:hypothetical protein
MHLVVLSLLEFGLGLARVGAKFIETDWTGLLSEGAVIDSFS